MQLRLLIGVIPSLAGAFSSAKSAPCRALGAMPRLHPVRNLHASLRREKRTSLGSRPQRRGGRASQGESQRYFDSQSVTTRFQKKGCSYAGISRAEPLWITAAGGRSGGLDSAAG